MNRFLPFHGRLALDDRRVAHLLRKAGKLVAGDLGMRDLPTTETDRDLDLAAFFQKAERLPHFGVDVVLFPCGA